MKVLPNRRICVSILIGGMVSALGGLDIFLRSYNEVSAIAEPGHIKTRIGDYLSREPMGILPVRLIWTVRKWPDRDSCVSDRARNVLKWGEFNSATDIEVCLTRVLNKAKTAGIAAQILAENGFIGANVSIREEANGNVATVSASCGRTDMPCGLSVERFWSLILKPYCFTVSISRNGEQTLDVDVVPLAL